MYSSSTKCGRSIGAVPWAASAIFLAANVVLVLPAEPLPTMLLLYQICGPEQQVGAAVREDDQIAKVRRTEQDTPIASTIGLPGPNVIRSGSVEQRAWPADTLAA